MTANDLLSGDVIYLDSTQRWIHDLQQAQVWSFYSEAITHVESVQEQGADVVGVELIAVDISNGVLIPDTLREQLRNRGPSVSFLNSTYQQET